MAPGGNSYQDVFRNRGAQPDYDTSSENMKVNNSAKRKCGSLGRRPGMISDSVVLDLLECPVCTNSMYPPIHQCPNGHTICTSCKPKVQNSCPICRQDLGNIRCLALEKIAESMKLPCKYQLLGCQDMLPYHSRQRHEDKCKFRPYNCPYSGAQCSVVGDIPFLVAHLKAEHNIEVQDGCSFNHRYVEEDCQEDENAAWMLTIINCFGYQFCLHFEALNLGSEPFYMAFVRFMGDENDASMFNYSLEVGGSGRRMTWKGIPRSIRDSHKTIRDNMDGLLIPRSVALFFPGGDQEELKLKVAGCIWRE